MDYGDFKELFVLLQKDCGDGCKINRATADQLRAIGESKFANDAKLKYKELPPQEALRKCWNKRKKLQEQLAKAEEAVEAAEKKLTQAQKEHDDRKRKLGINHDERDANATRPKVLAEQQGGVPNHDLTVKMDHGTGHLLRFEE